jgi:predicted ArsR family transcriptional regulator
VGSSSPNPSTGRAWTLITNHGAVLLYVADHPDARIRDIAAGVGITERATLSILADLVNDGYVDRERIGRRNHYRVDASKRLRHQGVASRSRVTDLLVMGPHEPDDASG